tara:strand:- start:184 stop:324 length:141 start_codon:yes stop_codon:yes gene_type:complete
MHPIEETAELRQQTSLNLEKQEIYSLNKTLDTIEKQKQAGTLSQQF